MLILILLEEKCIIFIYICIYLDNREEMINKSESHSELNKDLSNLRKLLEKLNEETIESNENLIVEYMKSMSKISV